MFSAWTIWIEWLQLWSGMSLENAIKYYDFFKKIFIYLLVIILRILDQLWILKPSKLYYETPLKNVIYVSFSSLKELQFAG